MADATTVPNHHAGYPGFSGLTGLVAALSMIVGRDDHARLAARLSNLSASDTLVDIGCGPGAAARYAARIGASVTAVDPADVMLRVGRLLTRTSAIRFVEGRAEALPVRSASSSVVWTIAAVHHWADVAAGAREVRRVLQPGGRFVAIERVRTAGARGHASHGWTEEQAGAFAEVCREAGLADPRVEKHGGSLAVVATG